MPPPPQGFASHLLLGPALRAQSDRRLVALVRDGYENAFEEIVRRYGRPLSRYAAAIVGSGCEDVTQDAFSKALLALRRDDGAEIELRPWLYRIVRNTALNDLRDRPPTAEDLAETIAAGRTVAEEAEQRQELTDLIGRLRALPEAQRAAIVMRELEGLSHDEIAAALGLSGGAARQAIFRARQALRDGVGLLLPLPLLRLLLEHGAEATAGLGAGLAGGTFAAGGAAGGAGAGTALKAGAVAAVLAGSVGTGIALQNDRGADGRADAATVRSESREAGRSSGPSAASPPPIASNAAPAADDDGGDRSGHGGDDDRSGPRGDDEVREAEAHDDDSGRGRGRGRGHGGDDDRVTGSSGPGSDHEDDDGEESRSGSSHGGGSDGGDSGSGSSGSGSSGSNSGPGGGTTAVSPPIEPEIDDDSSGSGSSGSGSDDDD